jgi:DNA polymerase-1
MAKPRLAPNQIELISDLPEHSNKRTNIHEIRARDKNTAIPPNYVYVETPAQLQECADALARSERFSLDTETRGLKWWSKKAVSLNVYAPSNGKAYFIPNRMQHSWRNFTDDEIQSTFEDIFASEDIGKIGHNFKHDLHFVRETWNMEIARFDFDTLIASIVLNENEDHDLESLCAKYLKAPKWKIAHQAAFELWPIRIATLYACRDAEMTYKLYEFQQSKLTKEKLKKLYSLQYEIEMPVVRIAVNMERRGVGWDDEYYETVMKPTIHNEAESAAKRVLALTGPINLDAPAQVASAFYDMLGLPRPFESNTVNEEALTTLKKQGYAVAGDMLEYRKYSTIRKMFVNKLPTFVVNGRIHCTFNTIGADTGRMSAKSPNLMQLPKRIGPVIRRGIIPSPGYVFVAQDFGQMELRMLAHFSEDPGLIEAFKSGKDIHTAVMCGMLGVSYEEYQANPDKPEFVAKRVLAKTVNFGVLYGMGPSKLAWKTGITIEAAKAFIKQYFETYPGIKRFIDRMKVDAYRNGYVETLMGRKRRLPDIRSTDKMIAAMAERLAVNAPIQGSVADLAKMTMLEHDRIITEERWPYELLLQIHDEVIYEVPLDWLQHHQSSLDVLKTSMANIYPLLVPIEVSQEILTRWGDKTILESDIEDEELELSGV